MIASGLPCNGAPRPGQHPLERRFVHRPPLGSDKETSSVNLAAFESPLHQPEPDVAMKTVPTPLEDLTDLKGWTLLFCCFCSLLQSRLFDLLQTGHKNTLPSGSKNFTLLNLNFSSHTNPYQSSTPQRSQCHGLHNNSSEEASTETFIGNDTD